MLINGNKTMAEFNSETSPAELRPGEDYIELARRAKLLDRIRDSDMNGLGLVLLSEGGIFIDQPAAETYLFDDDGVHAKQVDLTYYTHVRLIVHKGAVAAEAAATMQLKYGEAVDADPANMTLFNQTSAPADYETIVDIDDEDVILVSPWTSFDGIALGEQFVIISATGGDGEIDPVFGNIYAQFALGAPAYSAPGP
jgi:hypothetical protein